METVEDIVIVGAGIAGLATSLGLYRLGIGSLVLESSDNLRVEGFALTIWTNAWHALDALGVGNSLRQQHHKLYGTVVHSISSSQHSLDFPLDRIHGNHEARCVQRKMLLESLGTELPPGTIRYSSKVVSIEEANDFKLVHLVDGTILKTKILIGCDGVNSVVAKWLGFNEPTFTGRYGIRGYARFENDHGFSPKFQRFFGNGIRCGFAPCDGRTVYWFLTYYNSEEEDELNQENPGKIKQFALEKLGNFFNDMRSVIEVTGLDSITLSPLRYRQPWQLILKNICKGNVCVAGDALHPMTPEINQGGCSALEDSVILARCIGEALLSKDKDVDEEKSESKRIHMGLKKYSKERKWRSIDLIWTSYVVGFMQQSNWRVVNFLRDKVLSSWLSGLLTKKASFDCGKLKTSSH